MILDSPIISGSLTQQAGQIAEIPRYTDVSSSFLAASASFDARIDSIESVTASLSPRINALESFTASADGTYVNVSGDSMNGDLTITGSLIVTDRITAQEFHTEYISSSIIYESGSTKFGDSEDDKHQFTGSVDISGSITLNGSAIGTGKLNETTFNSYTASNDAKVQSLISATGSYETIGRGIVSSSSDTPTIEFDISNGIISANAIGGIVSGSSQVILQNTTGQLSASRVDGLNLSQIATGSWTASVANDEFNVINNGSNLIKVTSGSTSINNGTLNVTADSFANDYAEGYTDFGLALNVEGDVLITGSINATKFDGAFSGSFSGSYQGDGSLLRGLAAGAKFHTQTTPSSTWTFIHNLSTQYPNVTVYGTNNNIILPQSITATNVDTLVLEFGTPVAGYATVGVGGIIEVNGRTIKQYFQSALEWRFEHNIGDRFINIQTFDVNYEQIIPQTIALTDTTSSLITFPEATEGWVVGTIGGDLPAISSSYAGYVLQISDSAPYTASWTEAANVTVTNALTASYVEYTNVANKPTLVSGSSQVVGILSSLNEFTASNFSTNTFTSSTLARLDSIEIVSASNIARLNEVEIVSASNIARISALETTSASVDTLNTIQNTRLANLEIKTGSLATTGSNTFIGTQTITGSLFISANLIVQGTSSLENITASAVSIGTNIINLNTANPAIRYAGLSIGDSGSIGGSGSFLYDSVQDEMIFVHRGINTTVTSSVVLMGPQTYDNIGAEIYPTSNYIQKGTGNEHLINSCIWESGGNIGVNIANPTYPSTRNGMTIQSTTTAGSEFVMLSSVDTGFIGGAIVRNGADFGFINRTAGCLIFATNANERMWINSSGAACFACELTAKTIGTNDLMLSNLNYECANYVDGTRGSWLIQEGENDLFIINQISCKKYKFNLIEIK